ncbi:hypothetical protein D9611_001208 [Ephemerocybe angulata]|uniref:Uncharacterized protein n=1 Tax=Ephemerocybe angulata TaxID=980116 RepID=A0A8H5FMU0_9AGAR|nr:hypothetical protein D9611_001208 [Tulosesus angulatus]
MLFSEHFRLFSPESPPGMLPHMYLNRHRANAAGARRNQHRSADRNPETLVFPNRQAENGDDDDDDNAEEDSEMALEQLQNVTVFLSSRVGALERSTRRRIRALNTQLATLEVTQKELKERIAVQAMSIRVSDLERAAKELQDEIQMHDLKVKVAALEASVVELQGSLDRLGGTVETTDEAAMQQVQGPGDFEDVTEAKIGELAARVDQERNRIVAAEENADMLS